MGFFGRKVVGILYMKATPNEALGEHWSSPPRPLALNERNPSAKFVTQF